MMILVFVLCFSLFSSAQAIDVAPIRFVNVTYYKSPQDNLCFVLRHNFPSGPQYVRSVYVMELNSTFPTKREIIESMEHHYLQTPTPCTSDLQFGYLGVTHSKMKITIECYLGPIYNKFLEIIYTIEDEQMLGVVTLVDTFKNFGIDARVLLNGAEPITSTTSTFMDVVSTLNKIGEYKGPICVVTEHVNKVVLFPDYFKQSYPQGLIGRVLVTYTVGDSVEEQFEYPAFACKADGYADDDVRYVYDPLSGADVNTLTGYTTFHYFTRYGRSKFFLDNPAYLHIDHNPGFTRRPHRLYLIKPTPHKVQCPMKPK